MSLPKSIIGSDPTFKNGKPLTVHLKWFKQNAKPYVKIPKAVHSSQEHNNPTGDTDDLSVILSYY